jgi:hypothetical protein
MTTTLKPALAAVLLGAAGALAQDVQRPEPGKPDIPRADVSPVEPLTAELAGPEWAAVSELAIPIRLNGYFWNDTGFMRRQNAHAGTEEQPGSQPNQQAAYMQGRFVLGASYARTAGSVSALAHVELMGLVNEFAKSTYEPHTLDAYVKIGQRWWDFQIGRFLAWEVYYRGQGIELYTAEEAGAQDGPALYLLDYTRGLRNESGQAALHFFPANWLAIELAGVYGQENGQNDFGARPVVDARWRGFELVAGAEFLKQAVQTNADKIETTSKGYGGRLQYSLPFLTVGVDASHAVSETNDFEKLVDAAKSGYRTSVGGFADLALGRASLGLGLHYTEFKNRKGLPETNSQIQTFASLLYRLPVDGLSVKAVYGFARAHIEDTGNNQQWENNLNSMRVRILYEFH